MSPSDDQEVQAQRTRQHQDDEGRLRRLAAVQGCIELIAAKFESCGHPEATRIELRRQGSSCAGRVWRGCALARMSKHG